MKDYELKIKEWFFDKIEETSSRYNTFIDCERNENGTRKNEDGFIIAIMEEKIEETEKAIRVRLSIGGVVGSVKGWTTWIPKSVLA